MGWPGPSSAEPASIVGAVDATPVLWDPLPFPAPWA